MKKGEFLRASFLICWCRFFSIWRFVVAHIRLFLWILGLLLILGIVSHLMLLGFFLSLSLFFINIIVLEPRSVRFMFIFTTVPVSIQITIFWSLLCKSIYQRLLYDSTRSISYILFLSIYFIRISGLQDWFCFSSFFSN